MSISVQLYDSNCFVTFYNFDSCTALNPQNFLEERNPTQFWLLYLVEKVTYGKQEKRHYKMKFFTWGQVLDSTGDCEQYLPQLLFCLAPKAAETKWLTTLICNISVWQEQSRQGLETIYLVLLILCCLYKPMDAMYLISVLILLLGCAQAFLPPSLTRYRMNPEKVDFISNSTSETEYQPGRKRCVVHISEETYFSLQILTACFQ